MTDCIGNSPSLPMYSTNTKALTSMMRLRAPCPLPHPHSLPLLSRLFTSQYTSQYHLSSLLAMYE